MTPRPSVARLVSLVAAAVAAFAFASTASAQTLTVWPSPLAPRAAEDGSLEFDLVVSNVGLEVARDVRVIDAPVGDVELIASTPPARDVDGEWVWSVGDVAPGEAAVIHVVMEAGATVGARAEARSGSLRTASAPGVAARTLDAEFDAFLVPTVDADAADPEVLALVAARGGDRDALLDVVANDVDYEVYRGSLRGARGAWWSRAGNGYDQASLAIALLRAIGVPARYATAELSDGEAGARIASMFTTPTRMSSPRRTPEEVVAAMLEVPGATEAIVGAGVVSGPIEDWLLDYLFDDPATDSVLLGEARDHAWVEYHDGSGWVSFDPTGAVPSSADATTAELDDAIRHSVEVVMDVERYNPAFGIAGSGSSEVLRATVASPRLEGRPISVAFDAELSRSGGLVFGTTERNYTPLLFVGDEQVLVGDDFLELSTNFPAATTLIMGASLTVTVRSPGRADEEIVHRIADRFGTAYRTGLLFEDFDLEVDTSQALEGLSKIDVVTIAVSSGDAPPYGAAQYRARFDSAQERLELELPLLEEIEAASEEGRLRDDADRATVRRVEAIGRDVNQDMGAFLGVHYTDHSGTIADAMAADTGVYAYPDSPRVIVVGVRSSDAGPAPRFDLARHEIRVVVPADVPKTAAVEFRSARGLAEAELEGWALGTIAGDDSIVSFHTVAAAANEQGIMLREIDAATVEDVELLDISVNAKAGIRLAISEGREVLVPETAPSIAGGEFLVWLEIDLRTGHIESVDENGHHTALIQYSTLTNSIMTEGYGVYIGGLVGFSNGTLIGISKVLGGTLSKFSWSDAGTGVAKCVAGHYSDAASGGIAIADGDITSFMLLLAKLATPDPGIAEFIGGFSTGVCLGTLFGDMRVRYMAGAAISADPPLPAYDTGLIGPLRRPLSADRVDLTAGTIALPPPPSSSDAPVSIGGDLTVEGATELRWEGDLILTFDAEVRDAADAVVSTGEVTVDVTALALDGVADLAFSGGLTHAGGASAGTTVGTAFRVEGTLTGALVFEGTVDDVEGVYTATVTDAEAFGGPGALQGVIASATITDGTLAIGPQTWSGVEGTATFGGSTDLDVTATAATTIGGVPPTAELGLGGRLTIPVTVGDTAGGEVRLMVEGPFGWDVALVDGQVEAVATNTPESTPVIHVWAVADSGERIAGASTTITAIAPTPGLELIAEYTPIYTTEIDGLLSPSVVALDVRNLGGETVTAELDLDVTSGFVATPGMTTFTLAPGESGGTLVAIRPDGALPAPGTAITLSAQLSDGETTVDDDAEFAFPAVSGGTIAFEPDQFRLQPGATFDTEFVVTAIGNAEQEVTLTVAPSQYLEVDGVPESVTLVPGEEQRFPITGSVHPDATVGLVHGILVDMERGEILMERAALSVWATTNAAAKIVETALLAYDVDEPELGDALYQLADLFERIEDGCSTNGMREMEFRLRTLSVAITLPELALIAGDLWEEADEIAAAGYTCDRLDMVWICDVVMEILDVLTAVDEELGEPVFITAIESPLVIRNGDDVTFGVVVENTGDDTSLANTVEVAIRSTGPSEVLAVLDVAPLTAGEERTYDVAWDTSAVIGNHVVSAVGPRNSVYELVEVLSAIAPPDGNAPPVFGDAPPTTLAPREALSYTPDLTDPDGDPIFLSAPVLPPGLRLLDGTLQGSINREGTFDGLLVAQDRYGATATLPFAIEVALILDNENPVFSSRPPRAAAVDVALSYTASAIDPDDDALTATLDEAPIGATLDGWTIAWTPTSDQVGRHWFTLLAEDGRGGEAQQRFAVDVRDTPRGPDLIIADVDVSDADLSGDARSGDATVTIANIGDSAAGATTVTLYEDHDGVDGFGAGDVEIGTVSVDAIDAAAAADVVVALTGTQAFPGSLVRAHVDPSDDVTELDEANNTGANVPVDRGPYAYAAYRPTETDVVLLSPREEVSFRAIDPAGGDIVHEGVLEPGLPTWVSLTVAGSDVALDHFVIEADSPVHAYVFEEIFAPNFGADLFHQTVDGERVGREFVFFVPTLTSNNIVVVTAIEPSAVQLLDIDGGVIAEVDLAAGQWWEPTGIAAGMAYELVSTGDVVVQSVSVTGASVVPPSDRALAARGDVATHFRFSTRSRGAGGGAIAVFAYEDAEWEVVTNDGFVLSSGTLQAGEYAFQPGLGERRGAELRATGMVALMAGDIARGGADTIGLLGEDLVHWVGDGGVDLLVHTQEQDVAETVVLAGADGARFSVDDDAVNLGAFGIYELPENRLLRLTPSAPVVVQAMGGGDRYFDYGIVLRRVGARVAEPHPVLTDVTIDTSMCAGGVAVTARVGNAGGGALNAGAALELVALSTEGEEVVGRAELGVELGAGRWLDVAFEGGSGPANTESAWLVRLVDAGPGVPVVASAGDGGVVTDTCRNEAPVFTSVPPSSVLEGTEFVYVAVAEDPEGGDVRYALVGGPTGTSLRPSSGLVRWIATEPGTARFAIQAIDPEGEVALQTFDLTVTPLDPCPDELDGDDDGFCPPEDCDDTRGDVHPNATEILGDGLDNDCDPATTDVVSGGGLTLAVSTDDTVYASGETVELTITVGNESALVGVSGLDADVIIGCPTAPPAALEVTVPVPAIGAEGEETVFVRWSETAAFEGPCTATVSIVADDAELVRASAVFELATALSGTLEASPTQVRRGEPITLSWAVTNDDESAVSEDVLIRADGWAIPFLETSVTLDPAASEGDELEVDTAQLAPAVYRFALRAAGRELAEATAVVNTRALLGAAWAGEDADQDAIDAVLDAVQPAPIVFRPDGPLPGGPGMGGRLQAAWTGDAFVVRLVVFDTTDDATDAVTLAVSADGDRVTTASWARDEGAVDAGEDASMRSEITDEGPVITWVVDDNGRLGLENGRTLGLRVDTVDGATDHWLWADGVEDDAADDGVVSLYGGPGGGGNPDAGADAGADAGTDAEDDAYDGFSADGSLDDGGAEFEDDAGGADRSSGKDGCGCSTRQGGRSAGLGFLLVLGALLGLRRRNGQPVHALGFVAIATIALALGACSDSHEYAEIDGSLDIGLADGDAAGGDADFDAADADTGPDAPDSSDAGGFDIGNTDIGQLPGAGTGEECESDEDCASGICQTSGDYSVCTQLCDLYPCPEGYTCEEFPGGVSICVAVAICLDGDEDGYGRGGDCDGPDCNDDDASIHSGADELCNGIDDDCDGEVDEGVLNACGVCGDEPEEVCNGADDDCDGEVDEGVLNRCGECGTEPAEVCDGFDNDCNGSVDDGVCTECEPGDERACYGGPDGTENEGVCVGGVQRCEAGGWTECLGQVLPSDELCDGIDTDCDGDPDNGVLNACGVCGEVPYEECNGVDDDCDGEVDEGVLSLCGGCTPCGSALVFPYEEGDFDPSVAPAPDGGITLGTGLLERHDIWVPNSTEGSVSRWDTRTGKEVGRYPIGVDPSRTAVDLDGNVWVGHRGDGLVTHIYGDLADCVDRNDDGVIQTSRDFNGDGRITGGEVVAEAWDDPLADECVHCQVRVGNASDLARGVGVDADNFGWVGTWNSRELYKIDPYTCEIVAQFPTVNPDTGTNSTPVYGLAIDPEGDLWTSSYTDDCIVRVNTREARVVEQLCFPPTRYGMAIGADGRIWYASYSNGFVMYDPATEEWTEFAGPTAIGTTTGVVAANDGRVWTAAYGSNDLVVFDPDTDEWILYPTDAPPAGFASQSNPRGVTIDAEGHVWGIARGSSGLVEMTQDGEWLGSYSIVDSQVPTRGTSPYSYSDNTGFQLFNVVASEGTWRDTIDLGVPVQLVELEVDAYVPEFTSVVIRMRAGVDQASMESAEWSEWTEERLIDLRAAFPDPMRLLQVEALLSTEEPEVRPVLRDVRLLYETADCRLADFICPSGQICDRGTGACTFIPRDCFVDSECGGTEYCDATGICRTGCRLDSSTCPDGETCDPTLRVCGVYTAECRDDTSCGEGSYCASTGFCTEGCRTEPDSCPPRFECNAESRECDALPPECALDDDCPDAEYCGTGGRCLRGCRLAGDACGEGNRCDEATHTCVPLAEDCVPADPPTEVCNGLDDDCNGVVDDSTPGDGVSCPVGDLLVGVTECGNGVTMCRALPPATEPFPLTQFATSAVDWSSQYTTGNYSAARATGPADVLRCVSNGNTWAPLTDGPDPEFIHVGFDVPVYASGVRVYETVNAPFIYRIDLVTVDGEVLEGVWEGVDETECGNWFEAGWEQTDDLISGVVVHTQVDGWEYIDTIELVGVAEPGGPQLLSGTLANVILPAGEYTAMTDLRIEGGFIVESGAHLGGSSRGAYTLTRGADGDTWITGATFTDVAMSWPRAGDTRIVDSVFVGIGQTDHALTFSGTGNFTMIGTTVRDLAVDVQGNMPGTIEFSRFETTDTRNRWQLTLRGEQGVYDTELVGLNTVPRITDGLRALGSAANVVLESVDFRRHDYAIEPNTGATLSASDTTISNPSVGVRITGSPTVNLDGVVIDARDLGLQSLGIFADGLSPTSTITLDGTVFDMAVGDIAYRLDPDVWNDTASSSITNSVIRGADPVDMYQIAGNTGGGNVRLALFDQATRLVMSSGVTVTAGTTMEIDGIDIVTTPFETSRQITVGNGNTLEATNVDFEDVYISGQGGSTMTVTGGSMIMNGATGRNMYFTDGVASVTGTRFESRADVAANVRRHSGAVTSNDGELHVDGCTFVNLDNGVWAGRRATGTVTNSRFENYETGIHLQEDAVFETVSGCTFVDESPDVASVGIDLRWDLGGRANVSTMSFDIGDEDFAMSLEPDAFQVGSPSTFDDFTYVDGHRGRGIRMRGGSDGGELSIGPVAGESTFDVSENTTIRYGSVATIESGVTLTGQPGRTLAFYDADTVVTMEPGVTIEDIEVIVGGSTHLEADGVTFTSSDTHGRDHVDVYSTANITECSFVGNDRRQYGVRARSGGVVNVLDSNFVDFNQGVVTDAGGTANVVGGEVEDCWNGLITYGASTLDAEGVTFVGGAERAQIGARAYRVAAGTSVTVTDCVFDSAEADAAMRLETLMLSDQATFAMTGSTFVGGEQGAGYQLEGTATDLTVDMAHLEPAQEAWSLVNTVTVQGAGDLTIPDGVTIRRTDTRGIFDIRNTTTFDIDAAVFEDVVLRVYDTATGIIDGATFDMGYTSRQYLCQLFSTAPVTVQNATFRGVDTGNDTYGVYMTGSAEVTPSILNNVFEFLRYGIYAGSGPLPTVSGNTFTSCTDDTFGL